MPTFPGHTTGHDPFSVIRLSRNHGECRSAHPSTLEALDHQGGEEKLLGCSFPPDASSGSKTARQTPYCRLLSAEAPMLLHEPTPYAIPDIPVDRCEYGACSCAKAEVITPAPQDWIQLLKKV